MIRSRRMIHLIIPFSGVVFLVCICSAVEVLALGHSPFLTRNSISSTSLAVSIGLGPQKEELTSQEQQRAAAAEVVSYEIPDHEQFRTSRRSKADERCDAWFTTLLQSHKLGCLGELARKSREVLLTPVELVNEVEVLDRTDSEWTPYVATRLPWMPLTPAYGLEQYGLPIPRRGAEAWRQFDVNGLVSQPYKSAMQGSTRQKDVLKNTTAVQMELERQGAWLEDEACSGRLVYINGVFIDQLSKTTANVYNLQQCPPVDSDLYPYLARLTDGFTDKLVAVDQPNVSEPLLSKLSGPNHKIGSPTSQFAVNTQQGTACFVALNTAHVQHVAVVKGTTTTATTAPTTNDHKDKHSSSNNYLVAPFSTSQSLPVLVIQAYTSDAGLDVSNECMDALSALGHARVLIVAEAHSNLIVQQSQVDLRLIDSTETSINILQLDASAHVPKLINSVTQLMVHESANVSYTILEQVGGIVVSNVEREDDVNDETTSASTNTSHKHLEATPRELEAKRPQLLDTIFNTIDAHVHRNAHLSYTSVQMGGCGRNRLAVSTSLLQCEASTSISGFCLSGGIQRCETKTNIQHIAGSTLSRQVQKNLLGGRSTTSFRGRIRVEQDAQQTDAQQISRSILLTDKSRAWSVPSLEIIADDVKCTHGTTISDLSEEELFYLTSRGIGRGMARKLLMYAFASDVCSSVDTVFQSAVRNQVMKRLENLVPQGDRAVKSEYQSI